MKCEVKGCVAGERARGGEGMLTPRYLGGAGPWSRALQAAPNSVSADHVDWLSVSPTGPSKRGSVQAV